MQAANPNMVMEGIHLSKFADEGTRQQREALTALFRDRAQHSAQRDTLRATQMEKMSSARSDKAQKLGRDDAVHAALLKRKVRRWDPGAMRKTEDEVPCRLRRRRPGSKG